MVLQFEWDEKKNIINQMKHGVSFEEAMVVFFDPKKLETYDMEHSYLEERWMTVGLSGLTVLSVSFTERDGSVRIFSARKATKIEERRYFYGYGEVYNR